MKDKNKSDLARKIRTWVSIAAGVAAVLGFLIDFFTGGAVVGIFRFWNHRIISLSTEPTFSVTTVNDRYGRTLGPSDEFSYRFGIPITVRGVTQLTDKDRVWVVLRDEVGTYYLQNPPVSIQSNQWKATNIRPLSEITDILFVMVDQAGDSSLVQQVDTSTTTNDWRLRTLPPNSTIVGFVEFR